MKHLLLSALLALPLVFSPALADPIPLREMAAHLNATRAMAAEFTQVNADGSVSTGTVYIKRPGRARFEYDSQDGGLVIAGGGQVAIFDPKSNQPPRQFPLARTPLKIVLGRNVDFTRERMITGVSSDATSTTVTAQDPRHPEYGNIQMVFSDAPVELRQWKVTNQSGEQSTVILGDKTLSPKLGSRPFNIVLERMERRRRN